MSQAQAQPLAIGKLIHTIIGVAIMLICPFLNSPQFAFPTSERLEGMGFPVVDGMAMISLSPAGWVAVTIFIGLLWLWIFVDTFWPSILALIVIALNPLYPLPEVMALYFGNPTTYFIFFLLFFTAAIVKSQIVNYIANFFMTRDSLQGRPWRLMFTLVLATYFGAWLDGLSTVFILWPVTYLILNETGYKPGDKVSTFMVGNLLAALILAANGDIIKGPILFATAGYTSFVRNNPSLGLPEINVASWVLFSIIIAVCTIALIFFCMRFIFKLDVEPIKNFDTSKFKENKLPPMNWQQKTLIGLFIVFLLWMLVPNFLPASPITTFCKQNAYIGSIVLFFALISIRYKNEPIAKLPEVVAIIPWSLFFLLATAFFFGGRLTVPSTNISILLELTISNMLQGLSYIPFILLLIVLAFIATNLMNSIVVGVIVAPILATISLNYGFAAVPVVVIFVYTLMSAILTPAAGIPGALLYGNREWFPGKEVMFYAIFFSIVITLVTIVVGIPAAQILF